MTFEEVREILNAAEIPDRPRQFLEMAFEAAEADGISADDAIDYLKQLGDARKAASQ